MKKRSENMAWREGLSKASHGKAKGEKHKKALSIAAQKRVSRVKVSPGLLKYQQGGIKNHPNSWTINKRLCLERDGKRCRHCATTEKLQVHHMKPFKKSGNNALTNLITLCVSCHRKAEPGRLPTSSNGRICGVLLAGGRGTRLAPITLFHNKHELPVGGIPMIFHPLNTLRAMGVLDVMVILDREGSGKICNMLGDGSEFGMDLTYRVQNGPGGIAEALSLAEDFAKKRKIFVILGDNIFSSEEFRGKKTPKFWTAGCVFLKNVNNPHDYGIADVKNGRVVGVEEKPKNPKTNLAVTGLYAYNHTIFDILKKLSPSARGELEISDLNDYLAKEKNLSFKTVENEWMDAGYSTQGYLDANMAALGKLPKPF